MRIEEMDTPFLKLDLDALEENLDRFQAYFDEHKIGFRPHIKTHKNLAIARMQVDRGAIGLTCQKLGETEVLVSGGLITDYLVPYNIIGKQKLERLTSLAKQAPMTVAADSEYTVRGLSQAAEAEDVTIGVLIELEMGRTGVTSSEQAVDLGRLIDNNRSFALCLGCIVHRVCAGVKGEFVHAVGHTRRKVLRRRCIDALHV